MNDNLLASMLQRWNFTCSETLALLDSLNDDKLRFIPPGEKWKPLFWQFTCLARTQLVYAEAVKTGSMDFSLFASSDLPAKDQYQTLAEIRNFLKTSNEAWLNALQHSGSKTTVAWPDGPKPLAVHITSLLEHERLHHGQLISYFTLAGYELPASFKQNWAL